jgi:hypothetical protein
VKHRLYAQPTIRAPSIKRDALDLRKNPESKKIQPESNSIHPNGFREGAFKSGVSGEASCWLSEIKKWPEFLMQTTALTAAW